MNVVIVGGGKVGSSLALLLLENHHQVRVIEHRAEVVEHVKKTLPKKVVTSGDGCDPDLLASLGLRHCDAVAAMTGSDESNLIVASLAKLEFGVAHTVARINHPRNAWLFTPAMGVDAALDQSLLTARLALEGLRLDGVTALLELHGGEYAIIEEAVSPGALAAHQTLGELALPDQAQVIAVTRGQRFLMAQASLRLEPGDRVLALIRTQHSAQVAEVFGNTVIVASPTGTPAAATGQP